MLAMSDSTTTAPHASAMTRPALVTALAVVASGILIDVVQGLVDPRIRRGR